MSPRPSAVNEELRKRSRERLLRAAAELVARQGHEATTLGAIADRAGAARGLVSYYFPGKRELLRAASYWLMRQRLARAVGRPSGADTAEQGDERLARAIDALLVLAEEQPLLMRAHLTGLLAVDEPPHCPEEAEVTAELREALRTCRGAGPEDLPGLRVLLLAAVLALALPGATASRAELRGEIFLRFQLPWRLGDPPPEPLSRPDRGGAAGAPMER